MADGSSKPIDQVKVGDTIENADPGSLPGTPDQHHDVTAVHVTYDDKSYTDVTVESGGGADTITGTANHLYWDATTRLWTPADLLRVGDHLQSTNGTETTTVALRDYAAAIVTYNLTIDTLHNYYVQTTGEPVLVHNCDPVAMSSVIGDDTLLTKAARQAGNNQDVQRDLDNMALQLSRVNLNPGIGGESLSGPDVRYARSRNGARLFFRNTDDGIQIVGKSDKGNEQKVIGRLQQLYGQ